MLFPAGQQFGDSNFDPVGSGKLYVFDNGTTNEASDYSNPGLSASLSNPIVLDSSGRLTTNVYVPDGTSFTVQLDTSDDSELWSRDDVWGAPSAQSIFDGATEAVTGDSIGGAVGAIFGGSTNAWVGYNSSDLSLDLGSANNINVFLDSNNNSTSARLRVYKDSGDEDTGVSVLTIDESGNITTIGSVVTINGITITVGSGSPESSVTGPVGSLFIRTDGGAGSTLYVKESGTGNTGWAGV